MQHDYRSDPNPDNGHISGHAGDYANPLDTPEQLALPYPDKTFQWGYGSFTVLLQPTVQGYSPK